MPDYLYVSETQTCIFNQHKKVSHISKVNTLPFSDENVPKQHVAELRPVAVCVDTFHLNFTHQIYMMKKLVFVNFMITL